MGMKMGFLFFENETREKRKKTHGSKDTFSLHRQHGPEPDGRSLAEEESRKCFRGLQRGNGPQGGDLPSRDRGDEGNRHRYFRAKAKGGRWIPGARALRKSHHRVRRCEKKCPAIFGSAQRLFWPFEDPVKATGSGEDILAFCRKIRDQIDRKISEWLNQQGLGLS